MPVGDDSGPAQACFLIIRLPVQTVLLVTVDDHSHEWKMESEHFASGGQQQSGSGRERGALTCIQQLPQA